MVANIIISKKNESTIFVDCDQGIMQELAEHFTFYVDGYKFTPKFKMHLWDGKIRILDMRFGTLPIGLTQDLIEVSAKLGYSIEENPSKNGPIFTSNDTTYQEVENFIKSLKLSLKNKELKSQFLEIRPYQVEAIYQCIKSGRLISITPTGGGKSLIIYCLFQWYLKEGIEPFMLVVPNLSLLKQMASDFRDYSSLNGFDVDANVQLISGGEDKEVTKPLVISTWQSAYKMPPAWLNQFGVILADECHIFKAEAVKGIFERATAVKHKYGVTGSLDNSKTNKMVLRGLIGEVSKIKSTRDLIEEGHLSDVKIRCLILNYNKESQALVRKMDYKQEIDFICQHQKRNEFIAKLALGMKGNTLVLFNFVSTHGEPLYELIKSMATTQHVHFVSGKIDAEDREKIRNLIQHETGDSVTCASVGTCATGINIPRLHNIIFASPTKSVIRVIQSLGRGLRQATDKTHLNLIDIADNIVKSKTRPNYTMQHFVERLKVYNSEEHEYKIVEVTLER